MKDYSAMICGKNIFGQPVKNDMRTYYNIQKFTTGMYFIIEEVKETVLDFSQRTMKVL